jgi:hypothetical protein
MRGSTRLVRISAILSALLVGVFVCSMRGQAGPGRANRQAGVYAAQVSQLHAIKLSLESADRDYKGHRAAAVKHVTAAIRGLRPGSKGGHGGARAAANAKAAGHLTQAESDARLRRAIRDLHTVRRQLGTAGTPEATAAAGALHAAVKELEVALKIR